MSTQKLGVACIVATYNSDDTAGVLAHSTPDQDTSMTNAVIPALCTGWRVTEQGILGQFQAAQ